MIWTGKRKPSELLKAGDLAQFPFRSFAKTTARVQLEQQPTPQAAMIAIDNPTGEIKAMVGGYSFEGFEVQSRYAGRSPGWQLIQGLRLRRRAGKRIYGRSNTILDAPFSTMSGGNLYSPRNYDEKFEGNITLRRALAGSRNVPAVKLAEKIGISTVVDEARRFGHLHAASAVPSARARRRGHETSRTRLCVHRFSRRRHSHRPTHDSPRRHVRWRIA